MNFEALQQSVFLQALGSAILSSLWQVFIVWLIYETINVAYKTASARFKNNLSTILLFFAFGWFITNFISKFFSADKIIPVTSITSESGAIHIANSTSIIQIILRYAINCLPYLSVAYIFLLFFLMAKLFAAYRYVYLVANKRLIIPPSALQIFGNKAAVQMGITKKIRVWISHHIDVPATIGFLKPVILIPIASVNNLSALQLEAIILHELSHIKRNDYIINIAISVIETILFFNPFVLLLSKVIKRERENCCDDFVLQYSYDPHSYASALLCLEQSRKNNLQLAIGAVSGKKQLLSRIKRITNCNVASKQFNYGQKLLALLLVTGIICSVAWLSPEKKPIRSFVEKKKVHAASSSQPSSKAFTISYIKSRNSEKNIVKAHFQKAQSFSLTENNSMENISMENFNNVKNESTDEDNVLSESKKEFGSLSNLKQPSLFFDRPNIKLPGAINIPNFPFQNMSVNIDLSKIDLEKLNGNLKQAYKEINALNWNNIKNDVYENLSRSNAEILNSKNDAKNFKENAINALSKLKVLKNQQGFDSKVLLQKLHDQIFLQESLNKRQLSLLDEGSRKGQDVYNKWQKQIKEITDNNYYFVPNNYCADAGKKYTEKEDKCIETKTTIVNLSQKNIKIIISQTPRATKNLKEKKAFQYFFNETGDNSKPEDLISVQVGSESH